MINLGDTAKDTITGYTGIVVGRTEWINGCVRYIIQSTQLKDGVPVDPQHIDEPQLELVKAAKSKVKTDKTGGPILLPKRAINARR